MTYWQHSLLNEIRFRRPALDLLAGGLLCGVLVLLALQIPGVGTTYGLTVLCSYVLLAGMLWKGWPRQGWSGAFWRHWHGHSVLTLGAANRVTLLRSIGVLFVLAAIPYPGLAADQAWPLATVSLLVLILDGLDGWVARRTGTISDFGARFDMELDAALIMGLAVLLVVLERAGVWVLAIGLIRYGFVLAGLVWPWLQAPLPPSFRRQLICVWQVSALLACLPPVLPIWAIHTSLAVALGLLSASFIIDILWLQRHASASNHD